MLNKASRTAAGIGVTAQGQTLIQIAKSRLLVGDLSTQVIQEIQMKRVLVVDDDTTLRMALTRYLEKRSCYLVQSVGSATEALLAVEADPPDLIVSDVMMPEMDGFEFCRRLRATRTGQLVPFIFLSSNGEVEARVQGHSMGADDYLMKPFEPRELLAKIEAQLERSRRIHSEIVRLMQKSDLENSTSPALPPQPVLPLTPAEEKVFWEVVQGLTNKQIGDRLFVSPRTVQTHLSNILNKLELENRSQLVRFAFEQGYKPPISKQA
jgi:DNA-binding NarL/FixJ family response regulator